jgi:hypothetical protein
MKMVDKNQSQQALHIYLSQIKIRKPSAQQVQEAELQLLAFLIGVYGPKLVDPSVLNLKKTAIKVMDMLLRYFRSDSDIVTEACL